MLPNYQPSLFDMHAHLGFFADPRGAAQQIVAAAAGALCATVEPGEFVRLRREMREREEATGSEQPQGREQTPGCGSAVRLGVGLHPWWIADGTCGDADVELACELARNERYVAEVGLDFAPAHEAAREQQVVALDRILQACENGNHVLSIHAVRAADVVLDLMEAHGTHAGNAVIFHWFSGSGADLTRARALGCFFSINPRMLQSKRGRAYAQQIPASQLLLETDLPDTPEEGAALTPAAYLEALRETAGALAELKGTDALATINATSKQLLQLP